MENNFKGEVRLSNGLVQGHAYIITKVAEIEKRDKIFRLIRLYNPWGNDVEWNGDWSDRFGILFLEIDFYLKFLILKLLRSPLWNLFDRETKERLELKIENDGEFWYEKFKYFILDLF